MRAYDTLFFSAYYIRTARFFADEIPFTKTESLTSRITATWLARSLYTTSLSRRKAHRGWKSARFVHSRWLVSIRIPRNKTKKKRRPNAFLVSSLPLSASHRYASLRCAAHDPTGRLICTFLSSPALTMPTSLSHRTPNTLTSSPWLCVGRPLALSR